MQVYRSIEAVSPPLADVVLTVGNFDGVHRGHQQILAQAGLLAAEEKTVAVALTFDPHPLEVVAPQRAPKVLTPLSEKLRWLETAAIDITVVAASEPSLLSLTPELFVEQVVMARFSPRRVVEGASFGFGRGRSGDVKRLRELGTQHGFDVHVVEPVRLTIDNESVLVSSSLIRGLLERGCVRRAALCLGRPYALLGTVIQGTGRGRKLGLPTANLQVVKGQLVPAHGVYAGHAELEGRRHAAAISIGTNATFGGTQLSVEAHLLDFDGDLYGRPMRLELTDHVRDQQRFDSPEALRRQIARDIEVVRATLA